MLTRRATVRRGSHERPELSHYPGRLSAATIEELSHSRRVDVDADHPSGQGQIVADRDWVQEGREHQYHVGLVGLVADRVLGLHGVGDRVRQWVVITDRAYSTAWLWSEPGWRPLAVHPILIGYLREDPLETEAGLFLPVRTTLPSGDTVFKARSPAYTGVNHSS